MYWLYSALLAAGLLLSLPYWLLESARHGKYRAGLPERLGKVPHRLSYDPHLATIWVHAVSVGEVVAITGLVFELRGRFPQHRIVVSTTTATGQKIARERFGEDSVFYFPLDLPFAIRPYLQRLRPQLIVLAETEFWPNFLRLAHLSGAKIAVVNARISDRSLPGYNSRRSRRATRTSCGSCPASWARPWRAWGASSAARATKKDRGAATTRNSCCLALAGRSGKHHAAASRA